MVLFSKFFMYASPEFSCNLSYVSGGIFDEFHIVLKSKFSINNYYLNFGLTKRTLLEFNITKPSLLPFLVDLSNHDFPCLNTMVKASLVAQLVKHLPTMWEAWVRSLG